ncbi:MAG: U32 family peptidase [Candidatus Gastranaerophilales bacterium]|nr:U32 family peptidase [Candidatus Gastranaerophilales bacterium]MCM1073296.1 U32 family peptidase [Bacteroides sp.]
MKTELLSPAKDKETAIAAIDCGADAVYIGAPAFGARKNAANSLEDIKEVVDYAHKFWAKVFITMNTILSDNELDDAVKLAHKLQAIGIDALIIQDLGLLEQLMEQGFTLPLHMSTQCDNYLPQKVKFFNEIGVSRVVLARELSLEQIQQIHSENPNLELEAFVHGALCVSMSGQCYLSQHIGGRSANRGECAQPCRKLYSVETTDGKVLKKDIHALCLKDFNASNLVLKMAEAGVYSFKIEGRLKDTSYVKNITAYYRQTLGKGISSGRSIYPFNPNPEKSFNRGFTEYFLKGRTDCFNFESPKSRGEYIGKITEVGKNWLKIKTDMELHPQDGIYCEGEGFAINKVENGKIYPNKPVNIKMGSSIYRNFDSEFEKEVLKDVKRQIGINIEITDTITLTDEDGITLSIALPQGEKANNPEKIKETFIKQFNKTGEGDFYITDIKIASELPFMPVSAINKLRRELFEELMAKRIEVYNTKIKETQKPLKYTEYFIKEVDYRANVHNQSAKKFYEKCGVKVTEMSFESNPPQRQAALMRCKHCIKYALGMCKSPQNLILRDTHGNIYPLKFDCKNCEMSVLS